MHPTSSISCRCAASCLNNAIIIIIIIIKLPDDAIYQLPVRCFLPQQCRDRQGTAQAAATCNHVLPNSAAASAAAACLPDITQRTRQSLAHPHHLVA
jgi:hypothetical protein